MESLEGRVAVVSGAAGGIGRALAQRGLQAGLTVLCADVDRDAVEAVCQDLNSVRSKGTAVPFDVDVGDSSAVERFASEVCATYGPPAVVFANAGVMGKFGELWNQDATDLAWVFGVNVFGTANMIRAFIPPLLAADCEAHFVITGSESSFESRPFLAVYHSTKHALLSLAEGLAMELAFMGSPVRAHLLCPSGVQSPRLYRDDRDRFRPGDLRPASQRSSENGEKLFDAMRAGGKRQAPEEVAEAVFAALANGEFYIYPVEGVRHSMEHAFEGRFENRYPEVPEFISRILVEKD